MTPARQRTAPSRTHRTRVAPRTGNGAEPRTFDIDAMLDDPAVEILVCCGSGGVGKTTTAAAVALRAAERGRKVIVLTIDPARRLAQAMGLRGLDNTPRPVDGLATDGGGALDAMMLDMKRTFDEIVMTHASEDKAEQILENPFYQALSSSFAGTQEYMAMEKLGQLHEEVRRTHRWDLIVVDTPPSRSALDFLDAPERMSSFLDGRFIRLLLLPAKGPARLFSSGMTAVTNTVTKVLGGQLLRDISAFVAAFDTVFGGFRRRADRTYAVLKDAHTAFVVVASPDADALREASYFLDRLSQEGMPLAGLVVNRVTATSAPGISEQAAIAAADHLQRRSGTEATAAILRIHGERMAHVRKEQSLLSRFGRTHPGVPGTSAARLATDVHDLDGLRAMGASLAGS
jgi:anion-transporting  ArsA/GET3 family ATPase